MNKHYKTAAAVMVGSMMSAAFTTVQAQNLEIECKMSTLALTPQNKMLPVTQAIDPASRMPQKKVTYAHNGTDWELSSVANMMYDETGKKLTETSKVYGPEGELSFAAYNEYKYNALGLETEEVSLSSYDGEVWEKDGKTVTAYDELCPQMPVLSEAYLWDTDADDWVLDEEDENGYFLEVVRDGQDRVTQAIRWLNSTKPIALVSHEFGYGEEGPAVTMKWSALNDEYELAPAFYYDQMKWKQSNSQYLSIIPSMFYPFEADKENVLENYVLSACNPDGTKGPKMADYLSTFDDQGRLKTTELKFTDGLSYYKATYEYDQDENGSYTIYEDVAMDDDYDGVVTNEEKVVYRSVVTYNSHGEIVHEQMFATPADLGEEIQYEGYRNDITYNEDGTISEIVYSYLSEFVDDGYALLSKDVFSDYTVGVEAGMKQTAASDLKIDFNGRQICLDGADGGRYTVCDVKGKVYSHGVISGDHYTVDNLPEGMYIVKVSGKHGKAASKLIMK